MILLRSGGDAGRELRWVAPAFKEVAVSTFVVPLKGSSAEVGTLCWQPGLGLTHPQGRGRTKNSKFPKTDTEAELH